MYTYMNANAQHNTRNRCDVRGRHLLTIVLSQLVFRIIGPSREPLLFVNWNVTSKKPWKQWKFNENVIASVETHLGTCRLCWARRSTRWGWRRRRAARWEAAEWSPTTRTPPPRPVAAPCLPTEASRCQTLCQTRTTRSQSQNPWSHIYAIKIRS